MTDQEIDLTKLPPSVGQRLATYDADLAALTERRRELDAEIANIDQKRFAIMRARADILETAQAFLEWAPSSIMMPNSRLLPEFLPARRRG